MFLCASQEMPALELLDLLLPLSTLLVLLLASEGLCQNHRNLLCGLFGPRMPLFAQEDGCPNRKNTRKTIIGFKFRLLTVPWTRSRRPDDQHQGTGTTATLYCLLGLHTLPVGIDERRKKLALIYTR